MIGKPGSSGEAGERITKAFAQACTASVLDPSNSGIRQLVISLKAAADAVEKAQRDLQEAYMVIGDRNPDL